eukprot:354439-Chlamydomonas_euryale.AAC.4
MCVAHLLRNVRGPPTPQRAWPIYSAACMAHLLRSVHGPLTGLASLRSRPLRNVRGPPTQLASLPWGPCRAMVLSTAVRPTVQDQGGDVSLSKYMTLPVEQYFVLDPQQIRWIEGNRFALTVPRVQVRPTTSNTVTTLNTQHTQHSTHHSPHHTHHTHHTTHLTTPHHKARMPAPPPLNTAQSYPPACHTSRVLVHGLGRFACVHAFMREHARLVPL